MIVNKVLRIFWPIFFHCIKDGLIDEMSSFLSFSFIVRTSDWFYKNSEKIKFPQNSRLKFFKVMKICTKIGQTLIEFNFYSLNLNFNLLNFVASCIDCLHWHLFLNQISKIFLSKPIDGGLSSGHYTKSNTTNKSDIEKFFYFNCWILSC